MDEKKKKKKENKKPDDEDALVGCKVACESSSGPSVFVSADEKPFYIEGWL